MNGIINVLKPSGMSSNAVLTKVKKRLNIKKVGHLGTLDPAGTGVLPVTVGKATRLFDLFLKKKKVYRAIFCFGKTTDTLDSEGQITFKGGSVPSKEQIKKVLPKLIGKLDQLPPRFSAKNINGKRAYELARSGEKFELKTKQIEVYEFKLIEQVNENSYLFEIYCSSGTYIRSLCRDLAKGLNTHAFMSAIIRTESGQFKIENSVTIEELTTKPLEQIVTGFDVILKDFKKIELNKSYYKKLINGVKIKPNIEIKEEFLLYCNNEFFGISKMEEGFLKIKTYLKS